MCVMCLFVCSIPNHRVLLKVSRGVFVVRYCCRCCLCSCLLFGYLFVRFLILEGRSKFTFHPEVLFIGRVCLFLLLLLLVLRVVRFVVVVVVCCVLLLVVSNHRLSFNRVLFVVVVVGGGVVVVRGLRLLFVCLCLSMFVYVCYVFVCVFDS